MLMDALLGRHSEYTSGSINMAIVLLAIPMVIEMIMEALFAVVDIYFVSKVSVNAAATVGLTESVMMLVYSVAVGLSMAVTAIVARRVGEKHFEKAADAAFQAIVIAIVIGLLLGVPGFIYAEDILRLMGGDEDLINEGVGFTRIMYAGNLSVVLLFLLNAIFRGAGSASMAMFSLILANGLNIILDPIFIFGWGPVPAFGVKGAAIATVIGRSTGVMLQLIILLGGFSLIRVTYRNMVMRAKTIFEIIKISIGGIGQFLIESASWIFLVRLVSMYGSEAIAGYTIAFRVIIFTILPSWGLANAASTLVGQNLGAGRPDRAEKTVWRTALFNMAFMVTVAVLFFIFADEILNLFSKNENVIAEAVEAVRIICFGYIFFSLGMVVGQAFNGAGDTFTPSFLSVIAFWLIQIPLAYWLAVVEGYNSSGVYMAIAFSHSIYAIMALVIFRRGKWKSTKV